MVVGLGLATRTERGTWGHSSRAAARYATSPGSLPAGQVGQDSIGTRPVSGVLTHIGPHNGAVCVNYEHGGRSHAITQQVENPIGVGRGVVGVGQQRELSAGSLQHGFGPGYILHGHPDHFSVLLLESGVVPLQIHDLLEARASGRALVEDQHHGRFAPVVAQGDR